MAFGGASEPARAGPDWLTLREPADAAARSAELVDLLRPLLPDDRALGVHDLGCGTGAMSRWLAPRLPGPQRWFLHDRDAELLARVDLDPPGPAADGAEVTVETRCDDITRLPPAELAGADLVTASALLDMFTGEELDRFVAICARAACPVLVALSVVGRVELSPPDPWDRTVAEAFDAHQRRTTDAGRLLGPDASAAAAAGFGRLGLEVTVRRSPWHLAGVERSALLVEWLTGWLTAATEQRPELGEAAGGYSRVRLAQASEGSLSVTVHHEDLLAYPAWAVRGDLPSATMRDSCASTAR